MAIINRATKPSGSSNWVSGDTVSGTGSGASDLNADMNTVFNEVNGNLSTVNLSPTAGILGTQIAAGAIDDSRVNAAANIAVTKIGDASVNAAAQAAILDPGDSDTSVLATDLEDEIQQLRAEIKKLEVGANAKITDGTTSGLGADGAAAWFDGVRIGPSVLRNGSFLDAEANGTANPPYGWSTVATPTTLATVTLDRVQGIGQAIHVLDDGGADCGIEQLLQGLRASARYLVVATVKPITSTLELVTTGATGTFGNLALESVSGGSAWQVLSGIIETDATPTNIVVRIAASAANAEFHIASCHVYPIGDDPNDRPQDFKRARVSTSSTASVVETQTTISFVVPGPGYSVAVTAVAGVGSGATFVRIQEDINGGGWTGVHNVPLFSPGTGAQTNVSLLYDEDNLSVGAVYSYRLSGDGFTTATGNHRIRVELKAPSR